MKRHHKSQEKVISFLFRGCSTRRTRTLFVFVRSFDENTNIKNIFVSLSEMSGTVLVIHKKIHSFKYVCFYIFERISLFLYVHELKREN